MNLLTIFSLSVFSFCLENIQNRWITCIGRKFDVNSVSANSFRCVNGPFHFFSWSTSFFCVYLFIFQIQVEQIEPTFFSTDDEFICSPIFLFFGSSMLASWASSSPSIDSGMIIRGLVRLSLVKQQPLAHMPFHSGEVLRVTLIKMGAKLLVLATRLVVDSKNGATKFIRIGRKRDRFTSTAS